MPHERVDELLVVVGPAEWSALSKSATDGRLSVRSHLEPHGGTHER